jgi:hypothetical protein
MPDSGFVEGGKFICNIHTDADGKPTEFANRADFDQHCKDEGHTISGSAPCLYCKTSVTFENLPYQPAGTPVPAICENCHDTIVQPAMEAQRATAARKAQEGGGQ